MNLKQLNVKKNIGYPIFRNPLPEIVTLSWEQNVCDYLGCDYYEWGQ